MWYTIDGITLSSSCSVSMTVTARCTASAAVIVQQLDDRHRPGGRQVSRERACSAIVRLNLELTVSDWSIAMRSASSIA
jgi:hypothetical protein